MKTNKLIVRALILLGFGGVVGFGSSCGASRASKSRTLGAVSVTMHGRDVPVRVMYGVPSARYIAPDEYFRQRAIAQRAGRLVTGKVTDADSGKPLVGISVVSVGDPSRATFTGREGYYSLDAETADSLLFQYFGYIPKTVKITEDALLDVRMKVDPDRYKNRIATTAYGAPYAAFKIKGRVTDPDGEPVEGIEMVVVDGAYRYKATTDNSGRYSVSGGERYGGPDISVSAEDIDGKENGGEFASESRGLKIEKRRRGKVTRTANFTLTIKPRENESE